MWCYSNKTESVILRKCPYDHWLTNKAYLSTITVRNISQSFTYKMAAKINWHRYGTKWRHCHPMYLAPWLTSKTGPLHGLKASTVMPLRCGMPRRSQRNNNVSHFSQKMTHTCSIQQERLSTVTYIHRVQNSTYTSEISCTQNWGEAIRRST